MWPILGQMGPGAGGARQRARGGSLDFDVVVIGSGAGGGTAAAALSRAGRRVLVVERGSREPTAPAGQDERRMLFERIACDDRPVWIDGAPVRPLIGGGVGGSTTLFGAALVRPGPSDFTPGRYYGARLPRHLWEWPIDYGELAPYLERAEDLFAVSGDHEAPVPHLGRRTRPYPSQLPPLEPVSERLQTAMRACGLSPFRLPLAIDWDRCLRCPTCPGYACPTGARASSWRNAIEPALGTGRLALWEGFEALRLESSRGRVREVVVRSRRDGRIERVRAEGVLLGAGAIGTPVLLLRSGLTGGSDQVGRNHMCHLGAVAAAVFPRPIGSADRFVKQLGLTDFYLGTDREEHKMGYAQVVPIPGPLTLRRQVDLPLPLSLARGLRARGLLLTGSVEDLPRAVNRIELDRAGHARLTRRFHAYDIWRARRMVPRLRQVLRRAGAWLVPGHVASRAHDHLGHQVGTCRFGRDPRRSVIDASCRLHDHDNVWVVDGSFMPTSLGVGPALTIIANALRVSDIVQEELS